MDTTTRNRIIEPDAADLFAAERPYPARSIRVQWTPDRVAELFRDRRAWWLELAEKFLRLAEAGCADAITDGQRALAAATAYDSALGIAPTR